MIRGAIVGLGKMGISHASIVRAHPDVDLVAICDTSSFVINGFKKFSDIATYQDYFKMLENERLDFVVIATPTRIHYPMVKKALEDGIHVFCEKPFMLNEAQGKEILDISENKSLVTQVGYHNHFIGTFREMRRLIQSGILGEIFHFSGEAYGPVVTKEKGKTWRSNPEEGGGCLYDYASHVVNLVQEIISPPVTVHGSIRKSIYSKGVDDAVYALLGLKNGVSGTLLVNWSDETFRKMSTSLMVQGKNGKIICDATELKIYLKSASKKENLEKGWTIKYLTDLFIPVSFYLRGEEYSAQIDNFITCIKEQRQTEYNSFTEAYQTDLAIDMIVKNTLK